MATPFVLFVVVLDYILSSPKLLCLMDLPAVLRVRILCQERVWVLPCALYDSLVC